MDINMRSYCASRQQEACCSQEGYGHIGVAGVASQMMLSIHRGAVHFCDGFEGAIRAAVQA